MPPAATPPENEQSRLAALHALNILDTEADPVIDRLIGLVARHFNVPIALVSLVDSDRQWFKSCLGLDVKETPRDVAFCAWAIREPEVLVVEDSLADPRFCNNPLVLAAPHVRFYAGAPLTLDNGTRPGTLCMIDHQPRAFSTEDCAMLSDMAAIVVDHIAAQQLRDGLHEAHERFELAVNGAGFGIWDWDLASNELFWSARLKKKLGILDPDFTPDPDELANRLHPKDRTRVQEALRLHLEDRKPYKLTYRLRRNDGEYIWVDAAAQAIWDAAGHPTRMAGSMTEVTDRVLATQALERTNKRLRNTVEELDQYTYITSHDLKAPLRGVDAIAGWLQKDLNEQLDEKHREYLVVMRRRIARLQRLIADLLTYYRAAKDNDTAETVDLSKLVSEIHDLMGSPQFELLLPEDGLPILETARAPLALILTNLLQNAVKHHDRAAGRIEVGACDTGDEYEIWVSDDGAGIDPRYHRKVFGLFQTLRRRDEVEGSGIGLPVVKRTLQSIGQNIRIESDPATGRGTRFIFSWPKIWVGETPVDPDINDLTE